MTPFGASLTIAGLAGYKRQVHRGFAATGRLAAVALPLLLAGACVEPHTGTRSSLWCHAADGVSTVVDDMEDGDPNLCTAATGGPGGLWQMILTPGSPPATTTPLAGVLAGTMPLPAADMVGALAQSTRAIEVTGAGFTQASNAVAILSAKFAAPVNLAASYSSLSFWALADRATYLRANLATAADPASGARWGQPVGLGTTWGHFTVPLAGLSAEFMAASAPDLTAVNAIEFKYSYFVEGVSGSADPTNVGTFDVWIDDVELTP